MWRFCWTSELQGVAGDANRAVAKSLVEALIAIALLAYALCILIANLVTGSSRWVHAECHEPIGWK